LSGAPIPLLWSAAAQASGVIEVYPAATLNAHGVQSTGYKKPDQLSARRLIAAELEARVEGLGERCERSSDEFDACICLLSALDFLAGVCAPAPADQRAVVQREGWIWVRESPERRRGSALL